MGQSWPNPNNLGCVFTLRELKVFIIIFTGKSLIKSRMNSNPEPSHDHEDPQKPEQLQSDQFARTYQKINVENQIRVLVTINVPNQLRINALEPDQSKQMVESPTIIKLREEYRIQNLLAGDFVVQNVAVSFTNGEMCFLQEEFDSMLSTFDLKPLNFQQRLTIFYDIVQAVKFISSQNYMHRLICPSSVSIFQTGDHQYRAKLNSFEAARELTDRKQMIFDNILETSKKYRCDAYFPFLSPEIRNGQAHGLSTDIWSLGALFNYLLFETAENIKRDKNQIEAITPPGTPSWIRQYLNSMLNLSTSNRMEIQVIEDIAKAAFKCVLASNKFVPLGNFLKKAPK